LRGCLRKVRLKRGLGVIRDDEQEEMMSERFWEPGDLPEPSEVMKDWVSENVLAAIEQFVDEAVGWVEMKGETIEFKIASFDKPKEEGKPEDCFTKNFDLFEEAIERASVYNDLPSISPEQREDLEEFCAAFDRLAAAVRKAAGLTPNGLK
jgi:hypothetical protein